MAKLALNGGPPVLQPGWKKNWPVITEEDIEAVLGVMRRGQLGGGAGGPEALALEDEWAAYTGAEYALATNSGTSALHCSVAALGLEPGDEVIMPSYTFVASAMAVLHHNAIPIFADIRPDTYSIDVDRIREKISPKTRAIMPVHVFGLPADMAEIGELASDRGLYVIEDACQAHGATYRVRKAGTLGDIAGFSLQTTKNLMCGEGGLITTSSPALRDRAALCRLFGEQVKAEANRAYNSLTIGWNYRIPDMSAALARTQLRRLDEYNALTVANAEFLTEKLKGIPGIVPPYIPDDRTSVYYAYVIRVDPEAMGISEPPAKVRLAFQIALAAEGVPAGRWQKMPVPAQEIFQQLHAYGKGCPWTCPRSRPGISYDLSDFPVSKAVVASIFHLDEVRAPNGPDLMRKIVTAVEKVAENIREALEHIDVTGTPW